MEKQIIELEKKVAFCENTIEELTEVISDQHKRITNLENKLQGLQHKISNESLVRPIEEEEPPPHY
jgi:uncharacterized coiled-coil protein SlyX